MALKNLSSSRHCYNNEKVSLSNHNSGYTKKVQEYYKIDMKLSLQEALANADQVNVSPLRKRELYLQFTKQVSLFSNLMPLRGFRFCQ